MGRTLVVMGNGDVYYVSKGDADLLCDALLRESLRIAVVTDVKSGSELVLQLSHISALVEEPDRG